MQYFKMTDSYNEDVIDLTNSFTLVEHNNLHDTVIDLVGSPEDSIIDTTGSVAQSNSRSTTSMFSRNTRPFQLLEISCNFETETISSAEHYKKRQCVNKKKKNINKFGECPICWDELGKNPLASTKCGHVYCLKCLENALQIEKKCPCCRRVLKGSAAYHPLYLAKQ